ncbi:MAG: hypothetical protein ACTFAK_09220 [Candidatus Electronema sp. VV]
MTVRNVAFSNNNATGGGGLFAGSSGGGGAIFAMRGSVTLSDVSFSGNTVTAGSGANPGSAAGGNIFICTPTQDFHCSATVTACGSTLIVPVCGCDRDLPANTWLMTAPACQPADPASISTQYGPSIPGGAAAYGTIWIGYTWDAAAVPQQYVQLAAGDPLTLGNGSWLYSTSAAPPYATPTEPCSNYGSGLLGNCFAISLTPSSTARWQMVGHPFPYSVSWADVRVATYDGSAWTHRTPSQAKADNIMEKEQWRWNGSTYESKDDSTPLLIGTLLPQEAVWVRSLSGSSGLAGLKLLIPAR